MIFQTGLLLTYLHSPAIINCTFPFSYMFNQLLGYWGHASVLVFSLRLWLAVIDDASTAQHSSLFLPFPPSVSSYCTSYNASLLLLIWLIKSTLYTGTKKKKNNKKTCWCILRGIIRNNADSTRLTPCVTGEGNFEKPVSSQKTLSMF